MPQLIHTVDQIMSRRGADTLFLRFPGLMFGDDVAAERSREEHLAWLEARGIAWEVAAPSGWMCGDPGIYALNCEPNDPRILEYSQEFEDVDGRSLRPALYRMVILSYSDWLFGQMTGEGNSISPARD